MGTLPQSSNRDDTAGKVKVQTTALQRYVEMLQVLLFTVSDTLTFSLVPLDGAKGFSNLFFKPSLTKENQIFTGYMIQSIV